MDGQVEIQWIRTALRITSQEKEHKEMKFTVIKTENGKAGFSTEKCWQTKLISRFSMHSSVSVDYSLGCSEPKEYMKTQRFWEEDMCTEGADPYFSPLQYLWLCNSQTQVSSIKVELNTTNICVVLSEISHTTRVTQTAQFGDLSFAGAQPTFYQGQFLHDHSKKGWS